MNKTEQYIKEKYEKEGYDVFHIGMPDLICLKNGKIKFVEVKRPHDVVRPSQVVAINLLKKHNIDVVVKHLLPSDVRKAQEQVLLKKNNVSNKQTTMLRCRDIKHTNKQLLKNNPNLKAWCCHARKIKCTDYQYVVSRRPRRICDKTGRNATWNKFCDVEEIQSSLSSVRNNEL